MIVGRELELGRIAALLEETRSGHARTLVVRGEAGIGKTAVLAAAETQAAQLGFRRLRATGIDSEAGLAYSGLLELCRPILELVDALAEPQRDALRGAFALAPAVTVDRFAVSVATLNLLAEAAADAPLLVLVDDAQWLDAPSSEALWFAARRLDADAVAILIAVRTGEPRTLGELRFEEISLAGLSLSAASDILAALGSELVPGSVVEALHVGTAGNPLALMELARSLSHAQLAGSESLADPLPVPAMLQELFARRIEALEPDTRRALLTLAAAGSDDFASIAGALARLGVEERALLDAADAGLIRLGPGSPSFAHPLMRAAAYHHAPAVDRRMTHAALAAAAGEGSERAAWHRAAATISPDEGVAAALEMVSASALARGGYVAAGAALARAAMLTPERPERARRRFAAADAYWATGVADEAREMLRDAAADCDDPRLMLDIRHLEGHIALRSTSPRTAHELLLHGARAAVALDPAKAAFMFGEAAEAILYLGEFEAALATVREGEALAVADGGMGEFFTTALVGCSLVGTGRLDEGVGYLRRSIAIVETNEQLRTDPRALGWLVMPYGWLDEYATAMAVARRAEARARVVGALGDLVYVLHPEAAYEYLLGFWPQAYAHVSEAVLLARETGQTSEAIFALHGLAEIDAACGRTVACREAVSQGSRLADELGDMHEWPAFALGLLELGTGRATEAARVLDPAVRLTLGQGQHRAVMAVFDLVEAHVMRGEPQAARAVLDAIDSYYGGRAWERAGAARGAALLAKPGEYEHLFESSLAGLTDLGMRFEAARTELCWGERLRRDARRRDARERLRSALGTFEELGARPWAERASNELQATGETLRRDRASREELSARELQVALEVAKGKTNREAGAALFLSPKTVDIHLSRAYRKLGIHARGDLARALGLMQ